MVARCMTVLMTLVCIESNVFVYHSLNDGNLYLHDADTNESSVVMDDSIFVRISASLLIFG